VHADNCQAIDGVVRLAGAAEHVNLNEKFAARMK